VGDKTIIVPSHGPLSDKKKLIEYRDMLVDIRNKVSSLKSQRLSEEQAIAAKPSAAHDGTWGTSIINSGLFVHLVYVSLPASR
jgi:hypothetical protein